MQVKLSPEAEAKMQELKTQFEAVVKQIGVAATEFAKLCEMAPASDNPAHNELDIHRYEAFRRLEDFSNRVNNAFAVAQNRVVAPEAALQVLEGGQ